MSEARGCIVVTLSLQRSLGWEVGTVSHVTYFDSGRVSCEALGMNELNKWRIPGTGEPGGLLSMGSHRW